VNPQVPAYYGGESVFDAPFRFVQPELPDFDSVIADYRPAYAAGQITNGSLVRRFEEICSERLGGVHCVAVSSCTAGLLILLRALDLKGEILLPSSTFFASGHALLWNGIRPVFVDIDRGTWTMDPNDAESKIGPETSAILGVHLYGNPCEVERLSGIAARHRLKFVVDAAHAFGSVRQGQPVGGFGDAEVFSLSPTKILIAGEGGLIATRDAALARRLRAARNYGDAGTYDCEVLGINARMSEFHAALAMHGVDFTGRKVRRHNQIAQFYDGALGSLPGVHVQKIREGDVCTYKDYCVRVDAEQFGLSRDELAAALKAENIETRQYFNPPLHRQKLYRSFHQGSLPVTDWLADGVLSLPISAALDDETVERIAFAVRRLQEYSSRSEDRKHATRHSTA
jgi:dTDP-4-amino-4,6-dideoxygalactose transaminase